MTSAQDFIGSFKEFNAEQVDRNIGAWIRQFSTGSISDWQNSENILMRVLLDLVLIEAESLELPTGSQFEIVANALARALGNSERDTEFYNGYLASLSALSYAVAGNFPSAAVYAKKSKDTPSPSILEKWLMQVLSSKNFALKENNPPPEFISYSILDLLQKSV